MDSIEQVYLQIILEAQYDNYKWQRYGKYQGFEIYYNIEHVKDRINERYNNTFKQLKIGVNKFLKDVLKDNFLVDKKTDSIPFTVHCMLSNIWFSGRFKRNNNEWRVYISTSRTILVWWRGNW